MTLKQLEDRAIQLADDFMDGSRTTVVEDMLCHTNRGTCGVMAVLIARILIRESRAGNTVGGEVDSFIAVMDQYRLTRGFTY